MLLLSMFFHVIVTTQLVLVSQIGLAMLGIITVVAVVNYWLLVPTFFVGVVFCLLRIIYLSTSRSVKRLEGLSKCTE